MTILHKECLVTELATPAAKAEIATNLVLLAIQDEGSVVVAAPTAINFVGNGVTASNTAGVATISIAKPLTWTWGASGDGSATLTFSDGTTLAIAAMPFVC